MDPSLTARIKEGPALPDAGVAPPPTPGVGRNAVAAADKVGGGTAVPVDGEGAPKVPSPPNAPPNAARAAVVGATAETKGLAAGAPPGGGEADGDAEMPASSEGNNG